MNLTRDIQSLSDFKQNASKFVRQVQESKEPLVLTVNGKPAVVVQDAESYQEMVDREEYWATVAALQTALSDIDDSENWQTADKVFSEIRSEVKIIR
jgi:prevent-host-death family protein